MFILRFQDKWVIIYYMAVSRFLEQPKGKFDLRIYSLLTHKVDNSSSICACYSCSRSYWLLTPTFYPSISSGILKDTPLLCLPSKDWKFYANLLTCTCTYIDLSTCLCMSRLV